MIKYHKKLEISHLSLDLAGRSGYAIRFMNGDIKVGILNLSRGNLGGKRSPIPMVRLFRRLKRFGKYYSVQRMIIEETFARGNAKYRLDSLQHAALLWAMENNVIWIRMSPPQWKKQSLGNHMVSSHEYTSQAIKKFPHIPIWCSDQAAALWMLQCNLLGGIKRRKK